MFVKVPALDAKLSLVHRVRFHRQGLFDLSVDHFKKHPAAGTAVGTDRRDKFTLHAITPSIYSQNRPEITRLRIYATSSGLGSRVTSSPRTLNGDWSGLVPVS